MKVSPGSFLNHRFVFFAILLCALCGESPAQDFKTVHPGVEYAQVEHKLGNDPVKINLLRLDLKKVRLDVHHAFDKPIGVEPTSVIAAKHNAIAAINAGFFRLDKSEFAGDAAGILMIDGVLLSESYNDRATLSIGNGDNETFVWFGHHTTQSWLHLGDKDPLTSILLSGLNRERKKGEAIVYQSDLIQRPKRNSGDIEIWIGDCKAKTTRQHSDAYLKCDDVSVVEEGTNVKPRGAELIVSMDGEFVRENSVVERLRALESRRKRPVFIRTHISEGPEQFRYKGDYDITNGVPQLIKNGKIDITWEQEKASKSFAEMRHPRTAVAKLKDGKLLMITIDGRQPGVSVGMTLQELADYILSLGATDAMNLDGGGSTTMFLDGNVVNTPSDKEGERKVSDAILVTLRKNK